MLERELQKPLESRVEMDDAYHGGARSGGKRGRGSPGKVPFVATVETRMSIQGRDRAPSERDGKEWTRQHRSRAHTCKPRSLWPKRLGGKFLALVVDGMTLPANVDETQILDITVSGADGPRHLVEKLLVRRA